MRPTGKGPAVIFNNVKGHPDARVAIGVLASRERVAALLDSSPDKLGHLLRDSAAHPIEPVLTEEKPVCQEVIHYASEADFDLNKMCIRDR